MAQTDQLDKAKPAEPELTTDAEEAAEEAPKVFASRQDFLDAAGKLAEEEKHIESIGWLILREITGEDRAKQIGASVKAMNDDGNVDIKGYQQALLLAGVVDPTSPPGARRPLFAEGDLDRVMKVGAGKLAEVIDVIERLSRLGKYLPGAEGNSGPTPSAAGTS